ncbi:MAG: hypothetical protein A2Z25_12330 [Planctomycetes bacterium RBG_16_55_9]|nr:MAG: hypothetical protein A2Z25_12330 [Planctomycetes bacterium RBG_16_55_9]
MNARINKKMLAGWFYGVLIIGCFFSFAVQGQVHRQKSRKPRVIATTDGEIDDRCSMIRFLMYANEWDIRGLIHSSSKYHWKGDDKHEAKSWHPVAWLDEQIDKYAEVYPCLKQNDPDYPSPDDLRKQVFVGNIGYVGDMEQPTPGSRRIAEVLLDSDPSEVWLQAWGGSNTIARALKSIEEEHPDRMAYVSKKAKLFLIANQDDTCDEYILKKWPDVFLIQSSAFGAIAYSWQKIMTPEQQKLFDASWMKVNILSGHGPLCSMYEAHDDGRFRSEGDSPAFMHLMAPGLGSIEHPTYGGWGGRFMRADNRWRSAPDDRDRYKSILRWAEAFQNDWAARADWCVRPYAQCNHNPVIVCNQDRTHKVLELSTYPGSKIKLSAGGSFDPDQNKLSYHWWVYKDAGSYWADAPIQDTYSVDATITVPKEASGRTIHIILEVTDDGAPPLTAYRRVILKVSGEPVELPADAGADPAYLRTPITKLGGPPQETGRWTFYRGINLNGPPVEIDGNKWEGDDAPNFLCEDRAIHSPQVRLRPPTDEARARMIHSFRWNGRASMTLTGVPRGTYAVYTYVWEDNNPEQFSISMQGRIVARNHYSGTEGEWHRLGPWIADVTDGSITITSDGGAANFSGIEVWRSKPSPSR